MNKVKNIQDKSVLTELTVKQLFNEITNPTLAKRRLVSVFDFAQDIAFIEDFDISSIECFSPNFHFSGEVSEANIGKSSGFILFQISLEDFAKDHPAIALKFQSMSKKYGFFLVGVDGVTVENFKTSYEFVANEIGIDPDRRSRKHAKIYPIPFDQNAVIFPNFKAVSIPTDFSKNPQYECINSLLVELTTLDLFFNSSNKKAGDLFLRLSKVNDSYIDTIHNGGKIKFLDFGRKILVPDTYSLPRSFGSGEKRYRGLFKAITSFKAFAPESSDSVLRELAIELNNQLCFPPVPKHKLDSILKKAIEHPACENTMRVMARYSFPNQLSKKDRQAVVARGLHKQRRDSTIQELKAIVDKWDHNSLKLTQKNLQKVSGKNIKTIEKYYKLLKPVKKV